MLKIRRKNYDNYFNNNLTLLFVIEGQSDKREEEYQCFEKRCKE